VLFRRGMRVLAVAAAGVLALLAGSAPALAAPRTTFMAATSDEASDCLTAPAVGCASGTFEWYNRTAQVTVTIRPHGWYRPGGCGNNGYTEAIFEAFVGSVKTHVATRLRNCVSGNYQFAPFSVGNTNVSGNMNRIRLTVCEVLGGGPTAGSRACGPNYNLYKPGS
jgi:hypothetical protein